MSKHLAESKRRERSGERHAHASAYMLSESELMREIASAVRAETRRVKVSESEREALAQVVAETLIRLDKLARRGSAREVLAWIDRAERMPTIAARKGEIPRGAIGREYIAQTVRGCLTGKGDRARGWRDVAASYETARERQSESGPLVESLEAQSAGWLAQASARESEQAHAPKPYPLSEDALEIAREVAKAVGEDAREQGVIVAALAARLGTVGGARLAVALGISHGTLRNRVSSGSELLRERFTASELVALIRAASDALALRSGERGKVALGEAPRLDARAQAALAASERASEQVREGMRPAQRTYSPLTVRAARRNLRAERVTGRWGKRTPTLPNRRAPMSVWQGSPAERTPTTAERAERLALMVGEQRAALAACAERVAAAREVSGYNGR